MHRLVVLAPPDSRRTGRRHRRRGRSRGPLRQWTSTRRSTYGKYLALDEVLAAQRPRSDEHDELLFIVMHQVYELWFKQLLHELAHLQDRLEAGDTPTPLHTLRRVLTILKVVVAQIDVLETMSPRQFAGFRGRLDRPAASSRRSSGSSRRCWAAATRRRGALPGGQPGPTGARSGDGAADPVGVVPRVPARRRLPGGRRRRGHLLAVYGDDGGAAQVAEHLVDLDEGLQEWRYRHVKMVERTIGDKPGSGGSMGAAYLRSTLSKPVFPALWSVRSRL